MHDLVDWLQGASLRSRLVLWLLLLFGCFACAPGRAPELLLIDDISPTALEQNARLELTGRGFPDRRRPRLMFSGVVYRPGQVPRDVEIHVEAAAESTSLITLPVSRELLQRFTGNAPHVTFRGRITATFSSLHANAPPLQGSREEVVLDFFHQPAQREQELLAEAQRFLDFAGFRVDESLTVTAVHPEGEAHRVGLTSGDQLVVLDGVRLDALSDLVPRVDGWQSSVVVRRTDGDELLPLWNRSQFRPARLDDLPRAFVWIGGALVLLLLSIGGQARAWALVEDRLSNRRSDARSGPFGWLAQLVSASSPAQLARQLPPSLRLAPYATFFLAFALWSAIALGHPRAIAWIDFPTLLLGVLGSTLLAALILGGRSGDRPGWRLVSGLREVLGALVTWTPVLLATLAVVFDVGSLQLDELVAAQGDLPHQWRACASPWSLTAFVLLVASCVPEAGPRRAPWSDAEAPSFRGSLARLLEWFAMALACGLGAALFLGGWRHGVTLELSSLQAAALFLAKTWILLHAVLWWRGVLDRVRRSEILGPWIRRVLPLAFVSFGLQVLATTSNWDATHEQQLQLATLVLLLAVTAFFLARATRALVHPVPHVGLNPWL